MEDNPQLLRVRSNRRGVFVAGGCRFPQEISESLVEAKAVVQEVMGLLSKGAYTFDLTVAEVDPKKCAVCYTCPRLCPHSAITIEKYAEKNIYAPREKGRDIMGSGQSQPGSLLRLRDLCGGVSCKGHQLQPSERRSDLCPDGTVKKIGSYGDGEKRKIPIPNYK